MFEEKKRKFLEEWEKAKRTGDADEPIIELIDFLNTHPDIYTTSSCSGRITLSVSPLKGKKYEHFFLKRWHRTVSYEELKEVLKEYEEKQYKGILWLRMNPFGLHLCCRNLEIAKKLLKIAIEAGLKYSGILELENRIMLGIFGIDRLEMAIGDNGRIFANEETIKRNLEIANIRLEKNFERIDRFFKLLKEKLFSK